MVACKFFLQGYCKFGDSCKFDHPSSGGGGGGGRSNSLNNNNRFGALSGDRFSGGGASSDASKLNPWTLDTSQIRKDLGDERPKWILSAYGAAKQTPASLFEENEYSPEEIRYRFYELASKGQEAQADQEAIQLWSKADQDLKNAYNQTSDIERFMLDAEKKHPNRYDYLKTDGSKTKAELTQVAQSAQGSTGTFGSPSAFGQPSTLSNPFGKPAASSFGQTTAPSAFGTSPFGKAAQPSAFGQPAFGQPAAATTTNNSPFGQPRTTSAFGQPAAFGQSATASTFDKPAFGASGFGQQAQTNAFGQTSQPAAFGQTSQPISAFGQPTKSASPFGQALQPSTAFGQTSSPGFGQTGFGQKPAAFGQPSQPASGFGQSPFGQASVPANSPFGQKASSVSPFGAGSTNAGGFGQPIQQNASPFAAQSTTGAVPEASMTDDTPVNTANDNPFSKSAVPQATITTSNPFNATNAPSVPNTGVSSTSNPLSTQPRAPLHYNQSLPTIPNQSGMGNKLTTYKGQRVQYLEDDSIPCYNRPDRKGPEKIWYPEAGATQEVVALNREEILGDLQGAEAAYTDEVKAAYRYLVENGKFEAGKMESVPPLRAWIDYDF